MSRGRIFAANMMPVEDDHPVEWLRGRRTIGIAIEELPHLPIGAEAVVLTEDEWRDVQWLARLARGSSWPGEMAHNVETAAARLLDGES